MELAIHQLIWSGTCYILIHTYQNVALRQHKSKSVGGSLVIIRIQKLIQDDGDGDGEG